MKRHARLTSVLLTLSLATATASFASTVESDGGDIAPLLERQREIAAVIQSKQKNLSEKQREIVLREQATIFAIAEGKASLNDLTPEERTRLTNAIEKVDAAIKESPAADEGRMACRRERAVGSTLPKMHCRARKKVDSGR
jgi:ABC-type Fe3+-citrate transport system substrate-binding protein